MWPLSSPHQASCGLDVSVFRKLSDYVALAAAVKASKADSSCKAAPAEWLSEVSEPVKGVMSAMQQMASVAVQSNEQKDSSHARLVQSMTPDALLACGEYYMQLPILICCVMVLCTDAQNVAAIVDNSIVNVPLSLAQVSVCSGHCTLISNNNAFDMPGCRTARFASASVNGKCNLGAQH